MIPHDDPAYAHLRPPPWPNGGLYDDRAAVHSYPSGHHPAPLSAPQRPPYAYSCSASHAAAAAPAPAHACEPPPWPTVWVTPNHVHGHVWGTRAIPMLPTAAYGPVHSATAQCSSGLQYCESAPPPPPRSYGASPRQYCTSAQYSVSAQYCASAQPQYGYTLPHYCEPAQHCVAAQHCGGLPAAGWPPHGAALHSQRPPPRPPMVDGAELSWLPAEEAQIVDSHALQPPAMRRSVAPAISRKHANGNSGVFKRACERCGAPKRGYGGGYCTSKACRVVSKSSSTTHK